MVCDSTNIHVAVVVGKLTGTTLSWVASLHIRSLALCYLGLRICALEMVVIVLDVDDRRAVVHVHVLNIALLPPAVAPTFLARFLMSSRLLHVPIRNWRWLRLP